MTFQVMMHLWTLLSAVLLLLLLLVTEGLSNHEGNDNEVLKQIETNLNRSQNPEIENAIRNITEVMQSDTATTSPMIKTSRLSPTVTGCPGNQVTQEGSTGCGCPPGTVQNGDNCTCPLGFTLQGTDECKDVNECEGEGPGPCGLHASCTNTPGSYSCSCLRGYLMSSAGCQDIDECALAAVTGLQGCQKGSECKNTLGSFTCSCPVGYVSALNGQGCVDVDECSFEEQCHRELGNVCVNTPGSFLCQCQPGFRTESPACIGKSLY
ncbi:hypothetical protein XENORESO_015105 [Xenotaenia resolanae]|uniref:EGF-like domain-containing protein n=1 Tax=Xenotaenia resolanae TaxID=208358 RepID=A0ABV0VWW8_9TELE